MDKKLDKNKLYSATIPPTRRVDRINWGFDERYILNDFYIDAHCPRPYKNNKNTINELIEKLLIKGNL